MCNWTTAAIHTRVPSFSFRKMSTRLSIAAPHSDGTALKSLYRKRATPPCSCAYLAHSRFRYISKTSGPFLRIHFYRMGIAHPLVVLFIHVHTYVRSWLKLIESNSTVPHPELAFTLPAPIGGPASAVRGLRPTAAQTFWR